MKKVLLTLLMLMTGLVVNAQVPDIDSAAIIIKEKGVYEQKRVVTVEGAKASSLYRRAMEALSDWTGTEGRSKGLRRHGFLCALKPIRRKHGFLPPCS